MPRATTARQRTTQGAEKDFAAVFDRLKRILRDNRPRFAEAAEKPASYHLYSPKPNFGPYKNKDLEFASVRLGRAYVSLHLFSAYMFPQCLASISTDLKKRMQGKSCFNFKEVDEQLFGELVWLTKTSFEAFEKLRCRSDQTAAGSIPRNRRNVPSKDFPPTSR